MKRLTIITCALFALTISAKAQTDDGSHHSWLMHDNNIGGISGAAQVQVTYRQSQLGQLNAILNNNNIHSLPGNNIWINLSMNHIHKRWMIEDGIGATPTSTASATNGNNLKAKYNQFQIYARGAYNFSNSANFRVFPFAGINLSDAMLRVQDKARSESTSDFSQELLNSTSSKTLWNPQFGIELGGGFDYVIKMSSKQFDCYTVERNIPIGVRVGYYLQATSAKWKVDDNYSLNNGPGNKQSAVFVSVNIGLGYEVKK